MTRPGVIIIPYFTISCNVGYLFNFDRQLMLCDQLPYTFFKCFTFCATWTKNLYFHNHSVFKILFCSFEQPLFNCAFCREFFRCSQLCHLPISLESSSNHNLNTDFYLLLFRYLLQAYVLQLLLEQWIPLFGNLHSRAKYFYIKHGVTPFLNNLRYNINSIFQILKKMLRKTFLLIVAITTTSETYTIVFCVPMTLRITSILGNDNAGPANNRASAGPFPIPLFISPCTIGTSVSVAKYINAATTEAKKFAKRLLPPTRVTIHSLGIIPCLVTGPPKRNPANKHTTGKERQYLFCK